MMYRSNSSDNLKANICEKIEEQALGELSYSEWEKNFTPYTNMKFWWRIVWDEQDV